MTRIEASYTGSVRPTDGDRTMHGVRDVAVLLGIRPVHGGWRASEIEHLRFLKALVETGRIAH